MKKFTLCMVIFSAMAMIGPAWAGNDKEESQCCLALDLDDGSHVTGVPGIESIPLQTSYAKMDIQLKEILTIRIEEDHEKASIDLRNGDKLKGVISLEPIKLETVFGTVKIGVEHIRKIDVVLSGAGDKVSADDLIKLKKAGATDAVLLARLGKGRAGDFPFALDPQHEVLSPVVRGPLAVYPVVRKGPASVTDFLTLDEALEQRLITIREKDGGSVPLVVINNIGRLPIYLSAGEVVLGGKQDRMVAYDVLIEGGRTMDVEVRCVEKGRWQGDKDEFSSAKAMGGRSTRVAAQFRGQEEVWHEVAEQNAQIGVSGKSSAYNAALSKSGVEQEYNEYARSMIPALAGRKVVGMIVAVNGKVHTLDVFAFPSLFAKMKEKLLKAAVLDVIGVEAKKVVPPGKDDILSFYKRTMESQAEEGKRYSANHNTRRETPSAIMNESADSVGNMLHRGCYAK